MDQTLEYAAELPTIFPASSSSEKGLHNFVSKAQVKTATNARKKLRERLAITEREVAIVGSTKTVAIPCKAPGSGEMAVVNPTNTAEVNTDSAS